MREKRGGVTEIGTPKPETVAWVNDNREMLRHVLRHGSPIARPFAAAFLTLVPESEAEKRVAALIAEMDEEGEGDGVMSNEK